MALSEQINTDFIAAYKDKDEAKSSVLRMLKSSIKNEEIAQKTSLSDDDVIKIIQREIKQRNDSIAEYDKGGRPDLSEKEKAEIDILNKYLPTQLSDDEIEAIVRKVAENESDFGKIMGAVMPQVAGKADGNRVSAVVRKVLK
ncbi:MAG: GatB/YqeY domain-containing protein [Patescibacteria group bacterium]|jgi:hypothetical protein